MDGEGLLFLLSHRLFTAVSGVRGIGATPPPQEKRGEFYVGAPLPRQEGCRLVHSHS